jgi:hypothetical protein
MGLRLAFANAPDDKSRTGVVMSLEQMAPLMDTVQRRAIIEAFTYSEQALSYKVPLSFGSGAARVMLQAGYLDIPEDKRYADVREAIGLP